ncbi:sec-independent protein translocase protein TatC [Melghiribacillus thermohalophilus]|uniref:Sec-independent protein translocase protein TatC n=1 Tax=Melghiribacillus thermohalophilus TaxID=1324956 RepID=A0A4R3NAZ1_9BACI|nr:twin-arginine translocase subunit TatC [Melghiribacillus thermohalophilus]TCT25509.1 sec-independent protein translocase protein TatC [Melghiribacillus thermohalophilus]
MSDKQRPYDQEMEVTEHLNELRKRLLWSFMVFVLFFIIGFIYVEDIFRFFENDSQFEFIVLGPGEILWIYMIIASTVAVALTLPFLSLQIWLFVKPGLTPKEQKVTVTYIPVIFLLFVGGLLFGYLVIKDLILNFLLSLNAGMFEEMFTAEKYFRFIMQVTLPFAFFFEIPVISMFLTSLGIISPMFLKKVRKYAYLVLVILGTMLSPPDFILQLVVAIPLIVLYEVAIMTSQFVYRRKLAAEQEMSMDSQ